MTLFEAVAAPTVCETFLHDPQPLPNEIQQVSGLKFNAFTGLLSIQRVGLGIFALTVVQRITRRRRRQNEHDEDDNDDK